MDVVWAVPDLLLRWADRPLYVATFFLAVGRPYSAVVLLVAMTGMVAALAVLAGRVGRCRGWVGVSFALAALQLAVAWFANVASLADPLSDAACLGGYLGLAFAITLLPVEAPGLAFCVGLARRGGRAEFRLQLRFAATRLALQFLLTIGLALPAGLCTV